MSFLIVYNNMWERFNTYEEAPSVFSGAGIDFTFLSQPSTMSIIIKAAEFVLPVCPGAGAEHSSPSVDAKKSENKEPREGAAFPCQFNMTPPGLWCAASAGSYHHHHRHHGLQSRRLRLQQILLLAAWRGWPPAPLSWPWRRCLRFIIYTFSQHKPDPVTTLVHRCFMMHSDYSAERTFLFFTRTSLKTPTQGFMLPALKWRIMSARLGSLLQFHTRVYLNCFHIIVLLCCIVTS